MSSFTGAQPSDPGDYNSSIIANQSRIEENRWSKPIEIEFGGVADTETAVPHGLGVTPYKLFQVLYTDKAAVVYDSVGGTDWDDTDAYLKCNVATVKAVVRFALPAR